MFIRLTDGQKAKQGLPPIPAFQRPGSARQRAAVPLHRRLPAPARSARGWGDPANTNPAVRVRRSPRRHAVSQDHAAGSGFHMHQGHKINCGETKGVTRGARERPAAAPGPACRCREQHETIPHDK